MFFTTYQSEQYMNLEKQSTQVSRLTEKKKEKNRNGYNDFNGENIRINLYFYLFFYAG